MQKLSSLILFKILGWRLEGEIPTQTRQLLVVFLPHTSNWDFVVGILFVKALALKLTMFGKDAFYFWPFTYCYKFFGVEPIKRNVRNNFVEQAVALYDNDLPLWTGMAPEGTRSKVLSLKSGYYYIAKGANIPMLVAGIDFKKKALVVKPLREAKSSLEEDHENLLEFSHSIHAKKRDLAV